MGSHSDELLVDLTYSGVSEHPPWKSLSNHCRDHTNSTLAWFFFQWASREEYASLDITDGTNIVTRLRSQYLGRFVELDPIPYLKLQPGRLYRIEDFIARDQLVSSRYFLEFLHPAGLDHLITLHVTEASGFKVWLNLGRSGNRGGAYSAAELHFVESLVPHLQRALSLFASVKRMELERDIYRDLIENVTIGALAVDREGMIVTTNPAAERIIDSTEVLSIKNRRLRFRSAQHRQEFDDSLDKIIAGVAKVAAISLGESALDHGGLGLLMRPLGPFKDFGAGSLPSAVIYLSNAAAIRTGPASLVAQLLGLTATETELTVLLARGNSLSEAAMTMKMAENSARTCLKRIFAKTRLHRQTELVTLVLQSVASLMPDRQL